MVTGSGIEQIQAQATDLFAKGEYPAACEEYRKVLAITPNSAQALKGLGLCLVRMQQLEEGIQACAQAALFQPTDPEIRYAYGYALGSAKRFDEATEHFDAVLNLQPNHAAAKQALVYSLLTKGNELMLADDAYAAERYFDRAHKLDGRHPDATAALMNAYFQTGQKGKLLKLYPELDEQMRKHPGVEAVVAKMQADPEYQVALKQASFTMAPSAPPKPAQTLQQVPCPNCRQQIMEWAAVCPHCNFRIKAMGTFATHDRGPAVEWQEVALTVVAILWALSGALTVFAGLQIKIEMIKAIVVTMGAGTAGLGLGLIFRVGWVGFLAKILCFLNILSGFYGFVWAMGATKPAAMWIGIGSNVIQIGLSCFLIYLINYAIGD